MHIPMTDIVHNVKAVFTNPFGRASSSDRIPAMSSAASVHPQNRNTDAVVHRNNASPFSTIITVATYD